MPVMPGFGDNIQPTMESNLQFYEVSHYNTEFFLNNVACSNLKNFIGESLKNSPLGRKQMICSGILFWVCTYSLFSDLSLLIMLPQNLYIFWDVRVTGCLYAFEWWGLTPTLHFCIINSFLVPADDFSSYICNCGHHIIWHLVTCAIVSRLGCKLVLTQEV